MVDQGIAVHRYLTNRQACIGHCLEHFNGSCRRIEPNAVGQATVPVRIVGKHDGDVFLASRLAPQPHPACRQIRDERHPVRHRLMRDDIALGRRVPGACALERHGARQDPPVDLRQRDIHREVARIQPLRRCLPDLFRRTRQHHLDHRRTVALQHRRRPIRARCGHREAGRVQHHVRTMRVKQRLHRRRRDRILQARDINRQHGKSSFTERLRQRLDRRCLSRLHQRPVEYDGGGSSRHSPPLRGRCPVRGRGGQPEHPRLQ